MVWVVLFVRWSDLGQARSQVLQIVKAEGFDEDLVGLILDVFSRQQVAGDDDDARPRQPRVGSNLAQDVYPRCARDVEIEHHQIRHQDSQPRERRVAGVDDLGLNPGHP